MIANDLVAPACGAPDQCSGGLRPAPWQVYCSGILTSGLNTGLVTVRICGVLSAGPARPPSALQPPTGSVQAATAAATATSPCRRPTRPARTAPNKPAGRTAAAEPTELAERTKRCSLPIQRRKLARRILRRVTCTQGGTTAVMLLAHLLRPAAPANRSGGSCRT